MRNSTPAIALLFVISLLGGRSVASSLTSVDQGWYNSNGLHQPAEVNYFVGFQNNFTSPVEFRNFFVFDLSGITEPQAAATLRVFNNQNGFNDDRTGLGLTWTIYTVGINLAPLVLGTGGVPAFNDLGTGDVLGSAFVTRDTNDYCCGVPISQFGMYIDVNLNEDGLGYVNAHLGSTVAFGGKIDRVNGADNWIFGNSDIAFSSHPPLLVTYVPIPAAVWLLGSALGLLTWTRRKAVA